MIPLSPSGFAHCVRASLRCRRCPCKTLFSFSEPGYWTINSLSFGIRSLRSRIPARLRRGIAKRKGKTDIQVNLMSVLPFVLRRERDSLSSEARFQSEAAKEPKVRIPRKTIKKDLPYETVSLLLRRERDSNPRYLSVRRFSRPL